MQYLGRLSDGRTPVLSQVDLYLQQDVPLPHDTRLSLGVSVTNLFDQDTVISKYSTETEAVALDFNEADLYAGRLDFEQLFRAAARAARPAVPDAHQLSGAPRSARVFVNENGVGMNFRRDSH